MSDRPIDEWAKSIPTHDPEAERGFVGSLLAWPKYLDELKAPVLIEQIFNPRLQTIYHAMLDMREDDEIIDPVTVANRLREKGTLANVNRQFDLDILAADYPTGVVAQRYADIIVATWKRRSIAYAANDAIAAVMAFEAPETIQANLESRLDSVAKSRVDNVVFDIADVYEEVITTTRKMKAEGKTAVGIPTGFEALDALTSGLVPGEMFTIGGRPSQGKTALAVNILTNACQVAPALLISIEMGRFQISQRLLSSVTGINTIRVRHSKVTDEEIDRMNDARAQIRGGKFWIADIPNANIAEIVQVVRQVKRKVPTLAVVAVDYMGLIRHENRSLKRNEQVAEISGRLKGLARTLDVCMVAISQLNRDSEGRKDKRPELADLRESGAVEQDSDVVALVHRPEFYDLATRKGEADVIVCKVRNGPIGEVLLTFDKATTTFRNPPAPPPEQNEMEWPYGK